MYFHDICRSFDCLSLNLRTTATTQIRLLLLFVIDLYPNTTQLFPDTTMKARFRINTIQKQLPWGERVWSISIDILSPTTLRTMRPKSENWEENEIFTINTKTKTCHRAGFLDLYDGTFHAFFTEAIKSICTSTPVRLGDKRVV